VKLRQPPTSRADVAWTPPYEYQCTAGHQLGADHPLPSCPAYDQGQPCPGQLTRVGRGSRS
jgi:hypothetical protein